MTNKQPDAQSNWATELLDAQGHVTLSKQEAHEIGARLRSMGDKLKAYEDLDEAASDVQLLRMGYAAARLEIESLRARSVAHAGEYPALPVPVFESWAQGGLLREAGFTADQMRAYVDADRAMRAAQPDLNLNCKSTQKRLATLWGFVPAQPAPPHFGDEAHVAIPQMLLCAACSAIDKKRDGTKVLAELRRYTTGDLSQAIAPAPAAVAGQREFPHEQMDAMALARYKVMPSHESMLHRHVVVAGDGSQQLYIGREVECENMARKFAGAFLDGAFAFHSMLAAAPTPPTQAAAPAQAIGPCVICGSDEPFTGTCGGGDSRALCKQPAPQQEAQEPVYAFRRKGLDDFCTCTEKRYAELSAKPNLFETRIFYTAPQPSPTPQADSVTAPAAGAVAHTISDAQIEAMPVWRNFVGLWPESRREIVDAVVDLLAAAPTPPTQAADSGLEDAARLDWLDEDAGNHVTRVGKTWYTRPTYGHPYRKHKNLRAAIDAARAAQEGKSHGN